MTSANEVDSFLEKKPGKYRCFLIFGPPGAGKGTMSKLLAQVANLFHLSSGDIFRGISPQSAVGQLVNSYSSKGLYVPDDVTIKICLHFVEGLIATNRYAPDEQYILLDGIPRTLEQAQELDQYVEVEQVIRLDVPDENELIRRLKGRAAQEGRADDSNEEVLRTRLEVYREKTENILSHYPQDKIKTFNAAQPIPCVLRDILVGLGESITFQSKVRS